VFCAAKGDQFSLLYAEVQALPAAAVMLQAHRLNERELNFVHMVGVSDTWKVVIIDGAK
jgi:hypothetical protein